MSQEAIKLQIEYLRSRIEKFNQAETVERKFGLIGEAYKAELELSVLESLLEQEDLQEWARSILERANNETLDYFGSSYTDPITQAMYKTRTEFWASLLTGYTQTGRLLERLAE